ncbi:cell division protein FtsK [Escherichia coli]|nr:cell division protein FtsK [Escherichia coli]
MVKSFLNWLGAWLLATLFIFLAFAVVIAVLIVGVMFITWSLPEIQPWEDLFFGVRALFAFSAFMGFYWAVTPDWDDTF